MSTLELVIIRCAPPDLLPASSQYGSLWHSLANWDRLAALGISGVLFSVLYWVITSPDD
jgi:hypothetical protein